MQVKARNEMKRTPYMSQKSIRAVLRKPTMNFYKMMLAQTNMNPGRANWDTHLRCLTTVEKAVKRATALGSQRKL